MAQQPETIEDTEQKSEGESHTIRGHNFPIVDLKAYNTEEKETQFIQINQVIEKITGDKKSAKDTVTAACPYPARRLDKLYAALIRCLVLWTVTKQILVSCFKGLYLFAGGSDVTRGISCDFSLH